VWRLGAVSNKCTGENMITLSISKIPNMNVFSTFYIFYGKISDRLSKARKYRQTINELEKLPPRILEDIGINASNINSVAYSQIYKNK
tara:strand:+ start:211 stop:474 length:264 start_codon:yes stop_codon:yes gene_type:complete